MPEPTVAAGLVRGLMEFAVFTGASYQVLAERCRIEPANLQDPDNRIPFAKYAELMRAGQELCNDPALALHFGESTFAHTGIGCVISGFAETGADSFALFNRYSRLNVEVDRGDRFVLSPSAGQLWMVDTRENPNDFPELTELTFACLVCASRQALGEKQFIKAVHMTHAEPAYRAEYDRIFQMPVIFNSDKNALLTDDAWLAHRNPPSSPYVLGVLSAHGEALLEDLESSKSTRGSVERLLIPILHTGDASVDLIAGKLGLSRQTLFRKLKAEDTTFEKVLDELRRKLALNYLSGEKTSVNETACLLGFSDPAAFSRAFKRWTGGSPRRMQTSKAGRDQTGSSEASADRS
jgi:AraC-like DNA-binding protein